MKGLILSGSQVMFRKYCRDHQLKQSDYGPCIYTHHVFGLGDIEVLQGYGRSVEWLSIDAYLKARNITPKVCVHCEKAA